MPRFDLEEALSLLCCPRSGGELELRGGALESSRGDRYPIIDGIPDLTVTDAHRHVQRSYDKAAGAAYNAWIFNPVTMAFTWGTGVLRVPWLLRPERELPAGVVLEVPCGTGIFSARAYVKNPRSQIIAVDYSMGMLRAARARGRRLGVTNAVYVRADVAHLPLQDRVLDGCLSLAGFHAFPEPTTAASEIARTLKPGGRFATTIACSGERRISDFMIEHLMIPRGFFSHGLPVSAYRGFFEQAGLEQIRVEMAGAVMVAHARRAR